MLKKIMKWILYGIIIGYIIFAPYLLNNIFAEKYLEQSIENKWSGVITLWDIPRYTVNGSEFGWIKERISSYQNQHPNIHIDLRQLHYDDNKEIAFAEALKENHPDIMPLYIDNEIIPLDNVQPVTIFNNANNSIAINDSIIKTLQDGEEVLGVPLYYTLNVLIINEDLINNLGIKIPDNITFDDLINILKDINEKDSTKEIIPFDFYIDNGNHPYMPFLLENDSSIFTNDGVDFYNENVLNGLNKLTIIKNSMINTPEDYGIRSKDKVLESFYNNKTGIIAGDLSDINSLIRKQNAGKGFEFQIIPFPKDNNENTIFFSNRIEAYAIMRTENKSKEKAIENFLTFLLEEESQKSVETLGQLPVVNNNQYTFEKYDHLGYLSLMVNSSDLYAMPFYNNRKEINEVIEKQIIEYLNNNQPITETLHNIDKNINGANNN